VRLIPEFDDASDDYARDDDARDYVTAATGTIRDDRVPDEVDGAPLCRGTRIAVGRGFEQTGLGLGFEAGHLDEIAPASDDYALPRLARTVDDAFDDRRRR
jgi:hypothetical protein